MSVARLLLRLGVAALAAAVLAASHAPTAAFLVAALSTRIVQATLAYFVAVALLAAHPRPAKQPLLDLLRLLLAFPFYCGTILFDTRVWPAAWSNPLLGFPRDTAAMLRRPRWFFSLLKASAHPNNALPADADLVDMVPFGTVEEEPDKNSTIAKFLITYRTGGTTDEVKLPIFVKFQTSRGTPYWVKALTSAFNWFHNERQFYESGLAALMPMPVPQYLAGWYIRVGFCVGHFERRLR